MQENFCCCMLLLSVPSGASLLDTQANLRLGSRFAIMTTGHLLLGIENPLLDIITPVTPDFLAKYKLKANDADDTHKPVFPEQLSLYSSSAKFIAGGAAQNTRRGAHLH